MPQGVQIIDDHIMSVDPATGSILFKIPVTPVSSIPSLVLKSHQAQIVWSAVPLPERVRLLKSAVKSLEKNKNELARLMTAEMGKNLSEAVDEVSEGADKDKFLDLMEQANGDILTGGDIIVRDPVGVVAVIGPWNFPIDELLLLSLPALVAGNSVLIKPSEAAPRCGAAVVEALASVLPEGVVTLVQGDGNVGSALVNSEVEMIAMTGSTATGAKIAKSCATNGMKRLILEMGGKDPMVVFADADLRKSAEDAVKYSLFNAGQVCCSIERIYVEEKVKEEFEEMVVEYAKGYIVANGLEGELNGSVVGPLVSSSQKSIVKEQVESALKDGAKMLYQSEVPTDSAQCNGNFYPVTVLSNLSQDMQVMKDETFGPVIALATFDGTDEQAIKLSNDTAYGLAAYVYSGDVKRAERVARRIKAGQVGINCYSIFEASASCPWVGHKMSGYGHHSGEDGYKMFSVPKSLVVSK